MKYITLFIFLAISLQVYGDVTGTVIDAADSSPVAGATVRSFSADSVFIAGAATDIDGVFSITGDAAAICRVSISCMGYAPLTIMTSGTQDIGTVMLHRSDTELATLTVTGETRLQDATTETILLNDSIRKSFGNAAMMMGSLPGFKVDWISENISIGNDKDVPVIVNGREMGLQYAKSLNPKRIKSIEIQRYPPGQYSDYPILINIVLYENFTGWDVSGGVTGSLSLRNRHSNSEKVMLDATLSTKDWSTFMSASYERKQAYDASSYYRNIQDIIIEETTQANYHDPNDSRFASDCHFSVGADRKFGERHIVSVQTWLDRDHLKSRSLYNMLGGAAISNGNRYSSINSVTGLFYRGDVTDRLYLRASASYNYYDIDEDRLFTEDTFGSATEISGRKDNVYLSADATYSITDKWEATVGYNYSWRKYRSEEQGAVRLFTSEESRNKLDATVAFSPARNFNLRVGGSILGISDRQQAAKSSHTSFLPRLQAYWRPFRQGRITAVYLNEILYPNLDQLSTATWQISNHLFQTGNPDLRSKIMHYANVKFTLADCVTLEYMWRKSNNDIVDWYELLNSDYVKKTYINCDYLHQYIGVSLDKSLGAGLNLNFTGNYQWYRRWAGSWANNGRTWYGDLTLTWALGRFRTMLLAEYFIRHDREPLPQGIRYNQQETLAIGCFKNLLKGRLTLSAMLMIPVQAIDKQTYTLIDIPGFRSETRGDDRVNSFLVQLNLRFNLGKGKVSKSNNSYVTDSEK